MIERPILFSAPMVRSLLAGTKTQTRRIVKLPTKGEYVRPDMGGWEPSTIGGRGAHLRDGTPYPERACIWNQTTGTTVPCPQGVPGDRLWVRETLRRPAYGARWQYAADGEPLADYNGRRERHAWSHEKRSDTCVSIHMPRWASRITLKITDVRVERLNDISRADAIAEGLRLASAHIEEFWRWPEPFHEQLWLSPVKAYQSLWERINGPGSWTANPWVWAVSFEVAR